MKILTRFEQLFPLLRAGFFRFPLAFVAFVLGGLFMIMLIHDRDIINQDFTERCLAAALYCGLYTTAISLLGEGLQWRPVRTLSTGLLASGFICYLLWYVIDFGAGDILFLMTVPGFMALMFAPFINRASNCPSLWYFNFQTATAMCLGILAALVLGLGGAATVASVGYLFEFKIKGDYYADIWALAWLVLFPLYVLANMAKQLDSDEQSCGFPSGVNFIVNYILLPLMFVYLLILYAYVGKIALAQSLPRGNLGMMILLFGVIGIASKMIIYPIRDTQGVMVRWFDRHFYQVMIVPLIMLYIAIGIRVEQFGITNPRYMVMMMTLWLTLVTLGGIIYGREFKLKYPPLLLALLATFSLLGPWNITQVSINSQVARFEQVLLKHQLLKDGVAVKSDGKLPPDVRKQISTMAGFFVSHKPHLEAIKPWFGPLLAQVEDQDMLQHDRYGYNEANPILELLNIEHVSRWENVKVTKFDFGTAEDQPLRVSGYDYVQHFNYYHYRLKDKSQTTNLSHNNTNLPLVSQFDGKLFSLNFASQPPMTFDLQATVAILNKNPAQQNSLQFEQTSADGNIAIKLLIKQLDGETDQAGNITIKNLKLYLLIKLKE